MTFIGIGDGAKSDTNVKLVDTLPFTHFTDG